MTRDELIEAMARAICVSSGDNPNELESGNCFPLPWMDREAFRYGKYDNDPRVTIDGILPNGNKACCIWRLAVWKAQAVIAAIEAQGMAIVPVEPDDAFWDRVDAHSGRHSRSGETYPVQRNFHRAMIEVGKL